MMSTKTELEFEAGKLKLLASSNVVDWNDYMVTGQGGDYDSVPPTTIYFDEQEVIVSYDINSNFEVGAGIYHVRGGDILTRGEISWVTDIVNEKQSQWALNLEGGTVLVNPERYEGDGNFVSASGSFRTKLGGLENTHLSVQISENLGVVPSPLRDSTYSYGSGSNEGPEFLIKLTKTF